MILMLLCGYLGTGRVTDYFFLFHIPKFEDTWLFNAFVCEYPGLSFKEFEEPVDIFHKEIMATWLVRMLIVGHTGIVKGYWRQRATVVFLKNGSYILQESQVVAGI